MSRVTLTLRDPATGRDTKTIKFRRENTLTGHLNDMGRQARDIDRLRRMTKFWLGIYYQDKRCICCGAPASEVQHD